MYKEIEEKKVESISVYAVMELRVRKLIEETNFLLVCMESLDTERFREFEMYKYYK